MPFQIHYSFSLWRLSQETCTRNFHNKHCRPTKLLNFGHLQAVFCMEFSCLLFGSRNL